MALLIVHGDQLVCVSPSGQWRKIQRDRKSIWKKLSRLSVYSSTVSYLHSFATLLLFFLLLFFYRRCLVARNTSRFWRFALCDEFQFQLLKVFKVTLQWVHPFTSFFFPFLFLLFPSFPRNQRETFSHPLSNDKAVLQFFLRLFLFVFSSLPRGDSREEIYTVTFPKVGFVYSSYETLWILSIILNWKLIK